MMTRKYIPLSFTVLAAVALPRVATSFQPLLIPSVRGSQLPKPWSPRLLLTLAPNGNVHRSMMRPPFMASEADKSETKDSTGKLDVDAMVKYGAALAIQMGLFTGVFTLLDKLVAVTGMGNQIPFAVNFVLFYFVALKSRIFNPLCNTRPTVGTKEIPTMQQKRIMPSWTPPGFVFPIVWLLLIGPLRAATTAMIYASTGSYACAPILALTFHLSVGDVWNTINNIERRYGTSVVGMVGVYASAALAAFSYAQVVPLAGKLLALKLIWLTVASSLIVRTWQLNPNPQTGQLYSLLPRSEGDAKTEFLWF